MKQPPAYHHQERGESLGGVARAGRALDVAQAGEPPGPLPLPPTHDIMSAKLSTDVLELVVDELAADKLSLAACTLASSVLRRRARHHLFSAIHFHSLARATALADLLDADPTLGESVASLSAGMWPPGDTWPSAPGRAGLCALLSCVPHLVTLTFDSFYFTVFERESGVGALAAALPASLRRLRFFNCDFGPDGGELGAVLLSGALRLRSLVLTGCEWSSTALDSVACEPVVEPEDLYVTDSLFDTGLDRSWLSCVSGRKLVSLTMTPYRAGDVPFWQVRIDQAGPVMRKVILVNYVRPGGSYISPCTRAHLTQVHPDVNLDFSSLTTLRDFIFIYDHPIALELHPLVRGLSTVASPSLERVTLLLRDPTPELLLSIDWDVLLAASEAVRARSPQLRVVIGLYHKPGHEKERLLRECERITAEAIVAHGMEKLVCVERTQIDLLYVEY
jgi:hypothetical protein